MFVEVNGNVVMEAEHFSGKEAGTGNATAINWESVTSFTGASGGVAMRALPNNNVRTGLNTNGPVMNFDIDFSQTGAYYVYVRGYSPPDPIPGWNDTVHIGLDGSPVTLSGSGLTGWKYYNSFTWQNEYDGQDTVIVVNSTGIHTLNVWMREDGIVVDKIWVTQVQNAVTNGSNSPGPDESSCGVGGPPPTATSTPVPPTSTATNTPQPPTATNTPAPTGAPTGTPTPVPTSTVTGTPLPTATSTPLATATSTPLVTATNTPLPTVTNTPLPTATNTPLPTATSTPDGVCAANDSVFVEANGSVVMEAEHFSSKEAGTGNATAINWESVTSFTGASGGVAMRALPNNNVRTGLNTNGPVMNFDIDFSQTGTYYVYVRGYAPPDPIPGRNDTVHIGLDGSPVTLSGSGLTGWKYYNSFTWQNEYDGQDTVIVVNSTGIHTLNVWMREDGIVVDKIWVTQVQNAVPNGSTSPGPDESGCGHSGPPPTATNTPVPPTGAPTGTPTSTATNASNSPVATSTGTPTGTPTATPTPLPESTPTNTPVSPTSTSTPAAPTPTPTAVTCEPTSGNLIQNPSFEDNVKQWRFFTNGRGSFTATDETAYHCQHAVQIQIVTPGSNVQLYQPKIPLEPNTTYRLSFAAKANNGQDLSIFLHKHKSPYTNYGLDNVMADLTPNWQQFQITFTTTGFATAVNDARLRFWLTPFSAAGDLYWIDHVVLEQIDTSAAVNAGQTAVNEPDKSQPQTAWTKWRNYLARQFEAIVHLVFSAAAVILIRKN